MGLAVTNGRSGSVAAEELARREGRLRGEVARVAGHWFIDRDRAQLGVEILPRGDRAEVRRFADTPPRAAAGERCARLG
jgi:hypothetical protein